MENIYSLLKTEQKKLAKVSFFDKGITIFHEGEKCQYVGIILKGEIDISSFTSSGTVILYNHLTKGEIFGNNLLFSDTPFYRGDVITRSQCQISFIKKDDLLFIFKNNESFLEKYLSIQSNFGKKVNLQVKLLSLPSAEERFLYYLNSMQNSIVFDSVTSLSKKLFLKRETVSRIITKLIKNKIIIRKGNEIRKYE